MMIAIFFSGIFVGLLFGLWRTCATVDYILSLMTPSEVEELAKRSGAKP